MKPWRPPSNALFMVLTLLAVLTQKSLQQMEPVPGTNDCITTKSPVKGEPAQVRCVFPVNITVAIPVDITIERYQWFGNKSTAEVLSCTLTKMGDKGCKVVEGYTYIEPSGFQVQLLVTAMSQQQAGLYACKMMTKSLPEPFQKTCELKLSDTPERPVITTLPAVTATQDNKAQEGSVPVGIIAGAVGAVVVVAVVALVVILLIRRRRRRLAKAAKENTTAIDWISEDEEESTPCCDKLRHWLCGCQCRRERDGDAAATKGNGVNEGLVKERAEKFGGSISVPPESKKPLMKKSSENPYTEPHSIGNGRKVSKKETSKPIYTKPLKKPLLGNENTDKNDLPLKPSRSNSQEKKPQGGGKTTEKPCSLADKKSDPNAPYKPVHFADSPEEFVEICLDAKAKLKPVPESEAPEAKASGADAAALKKKRAPEAIEFENSIKEQRERLASLNTEKTRKEKIESEAKEYEKELAARRERLKSSQSSQEGKELPSPSVPGAKPVPAKRERLISQESSHSARSGPVPSEDKVPEKEKEAEIARLMAGLKPKDNLQLLPESVEESVRA